MFSLVSIWSNVGSRKQAFDDDAVDRLSHRYTVVLLVCFALVITSYQYVGDPITCWVPQHFTGSHTKYTNAFCWVKNTYYLPFDEYIPDEMTYEDKYEEETELPYYQWLPFIMLGQAVFFYIPSRVWRCFNNKAGVDSDDILQAASHFDKTEKINDRDRMLTLIVNQLDRFVGSTKRRQRKRNRGIGKKFGNYLVLLYLFVKILYIVNVFCQLFVLDRVLGTEFHSFGVQMLEKIQDDEFGTVHANSSSFPRVTMCNFKVRRLGNIHRYAVQCVLPINLYAEKMYIFLWFWMIFVLSFTLLSLIIWIIQMCMARDQLTYIRNHLKSANRIETNFDNQLCRDFVDHYLRSDGVFVLRLISHNTNNITSTEIIVALWDEWRSGNPLATETPPPPLTSEETPEKDDEPRYVPNTEKPPLPEALPLYPSAPEPFEDPSTQKPPLKQKPPPPPKPAHLSPSKNLGPY